MSSPFLRGKSPATGFRNLDEALHLERHNIFSAAKAGSKDAVLFFPGCGAGLFYRDIGLASLALILESGKSVILPDRHYCCGFPLLASGCAESYEKIRNDNKKALQGILDSSDKLGFEPAFVLTSCGTCREGISTYRLKSTKDELKRMDVVQYLLDTLTPAGAVGEERILYHPSCHAEWTGVNLLKSGEIYAARLEKFLGTRIEISPGCCGESGLGAMTSPEIYNLIRSRKQETLSEQIPGYSENSPLLVGCPSCRIGISRSLFELKSKIKVLHTVEYMARIRLGEKWKSDLLNKISTGKRSGHQLVLSSR